MRPIAVFRFSPTEGPAYFGEWLDRHRHSRRLIALDEGAAVPGDPEAYAGIAMMGGPMGVNDPLPWIEPMRALLRRAVRREIPIIGHCLGGQLLASALGAPVVRAGIPELGWIDVDVAAAARDEWFGGRASFPTFQWHYDAFAMPAGATRVLSNPHHAEQGFVVDDRHLGLQCHVEMTGDLVESWLSTGAAELPPTSSPSRQSETEIRRELANRVASLNAVADDVYARWARALRH